MAKKVVKISATQLLINTIAEKVKKTFTFAGSSFIKANPSNAEGSGVEFSVDDEAFAAAVKKAVGDGGAGDSYTFEGDDYIGVSVSDAK